MLTFSATSGDGLDDQLLNNCAKLFSENYGIWGNLAAPPLSGTFPQHPDRSEPGLKTPCRETRQNERSQT